MNVPGLPVRATLPVTLVTWGLACRSMDRMSFWIRPAMVIRWPTLIVPLPGIVVFVGLAKGVVLCRMPLIRLRLAVESGALLPLTVWDSPCTCV